VDVAKRHLLPIREARLAIDFDVPTTHDTRLTTT